MVWKPIVYTFCLLESWSHDQSECTNISHCKTQFLAESLNMWSLHLQDNFHNILRFFKKKYTSEANYSTTLSNIQSRGLRIF